jgi:hypothetical protein
LAGGSGRRDGDGIGGVGFQSGKRGGGSGRGGRGGFGGGQNGFGNKASSADASSGRKEVKVDEPPCKSCSKLIRYYLLVSLILIRTLCVAARIQRS